MAVDDDIDALEEELEGLDDEDDDRAATIRRFLPVIIAGGAAFVLVIGVIVANIGGDDEELIVTNVANLGGGATIKINPESPGAPVGDQALENPAYDPMKKGDDDTDIAKITPPPETPMDAGAGAVPPPEAPVMEGDGKKDGKDAAAVDAQPGKDGKDPDAKAGAESLLAMTPDDKMTPEGEAMKDDGKKEPEAETAKATEPAPDAKKDEKTDDKAEDKAGEKQTEVAQIGTKLLQPSGKQDEKTMAPADSGSGATTTAFRTMDGVYRIQVASAKSENQARNEWKAQVSRFPDVLSKLSLTVQTAVVKDRGTFYRVQGGPFSDRNSADNVCRTLKDRGQDCLVVRP